MAINKSRGGYARLDVANRLDEVSVADELFFNLDGQLLVVDDAYWRVEVCGVHSSATEHWVQLNLSGPLQAPLTVRTAALDASSVLQNVSAWIEHGYSATRGKIH